MTTPKNLQRDPKQWELAAAKYDLERLGMEMLNEYIIRGLSFKAKDVDLITLRFDVYRDMLLKRTSRPYHSLGLNLIRIGYPNLAQFEKFKLGWEKEIEESDDEFGLFNPKERAKWSNYDSISVENLLLDWLYIWNKELPNETGATTESLCGTITRITYESFEYNYRQKRNILIRPPMDGEINWGNDMIELLGPFMGAFWNRYYLRQDGVDLRIYKGKYDHGWTCRKHSWIKKLWG